VDLFLRIIKFVAYIFIVILVSSAIVTPFSFSVFYWGYAFAQDTPEGIGPPVDPPDGFVNVPEFSDNIGIISTGNTTVTTSPVTEFNEGVVIISSSTTTTSTEGPTNGTSPVTEFNEGVVIISSSTTTTSTEGPTNGTSSEGPTNGTSPVTEFNEGVVIISSSTTTTSTEGPTNGTSPVTEFNEGDVIISSSTTSVPPDATESWQFENDTSNVTLIGDASVNGNEGINGTSLLLDGDLDFAVTNSTNATTYITDMSIAAWVKPNYTKGSPEFTVVSKGKSFVLSINNIIDPKHIAKFAIFDGIKWTTVYSTSTIPELSWTHITARFNKTAIEIYVNGTMEASLPHNGIPFVNEKGQIQLKTLQEITSYSDIVIGASITSDMNTPYNMFSGLIDSVQLFDNNLKKSDITKIFDYNIPTFTFVPQEFLPIGIPLPFIEFTNNTSNLVHSDITIGKTLSLILNHLQMQCYQFGILSS